MRDETVNFEIVQFQSCLCDDRNLGKSISLLLQFIRCSMALVVTISIDLYAVCHKICLNWLFLYFSPILSVSQPQLSSDFPVGTPGTCSGDACFHCTRMQSRRAQAFKHKTTQYHVIHLTQTRRRFSKGRLIPAKKIFFVNFKTPKVRKYARGV